MAASIIIMFLDELIQKGWDTKPSETLEAGFTWVKTITLAELKNKYNGNYLIEKGFKNEEIKLEQMRLILDEM